MSKSDTIRKRYTDYVREHGLKQTRQREVILSTFLDMGGEEHASLDDLLSLVQRRMPGVGYATVYRTMKLLVRAEVAHERRFRDGQTRYEVVDPEDEHHDHIICVDCGFIHEFEDPEIERRQDLAAEAAGMRIVSHRLDIYANCKDVQGCAHRQALEAERGG